MSFFKLWHLFYSFGIEQEDSIFERPTSIIGGFFFAIFFYTLFLFRGLK
jgi:hypothetical protein